jgi:AmmeMemoRadiSam system protein B
MGGGDTTRGCPAVFLYRSRHLAIYGRLKELATPGMGAARWKNNFGCVGPDEGIAKHATGRKVEEMYRDASSGLKLRPPAVAGLFYPEDPDELAAMVRGLLASGQERLRHRLEQIGESKSKNDSSVRSGSLESLVGLIAPHAGYIYSGEVAGVAYAAVLHSKTRFSRAAVFGPSHRVFLRGMAVPSVEGFEMPGFVLQADEGGVEALSSLSSVVVDDVPHREEHSIEVHFPFIREVLGEVPVVAVTIGDAGPAEVAEAIALMLEDPERLVVISSDLSHYLDYETARAVDEQTARSIEALRYEDLGYESACGRNGIRGLLFLARRKGMRLLRLDLRNSGDTAGPRDGVVGYPAFAALGAKA